MPFTLRIGEQAPDFDLPATDGKRYSLKSFPNARVLVLFFTCNHCPFVIGSEERMIEFCLKYATRHVQMVGINSNESDNHPHDSFENMVQRARDRCFPFPYLRDERQDVARAYGALRTPHYFVFSRDEDGPWRLRYTGRMDDNPRQPGKQTTHELQDAVEAILKGNEPAVLMTNPIGCNVKWRGEAEHWMPPEACDLV